MKAGRREYFRKIEYLQICLFCQYSLVHLKLPILCIFSSEALILQTFPHFGNSFLS
jgi:hypothetical protein